MKSSCDNKIIRGIEVQGVVFCGPSGELHDDNEDKQQEEENLKALEAYWHNKGFEEGQSSGFAAGLKEGDEQGYNRGKDEGMNQGLEEGKKQAFEEGMKEGYEKSKTELVDVFDLVNSMADRVTEEKQRLVNLFKPELIKFAMGVCEAMLRFELSHPQVLVSAIERLILDAKPILSGEKINVVLSPDDLKMLEERLNDIKYDPHDVRKIHFETDFAIPRGDLRVETPMGLINFDVNRLLSDLQTDLLEVKDEPETETNTL